jgi:hypothetical protein
VSHPALLLIAVVAAPANSRPGPEMVAARDYAGCIGFTAVVSGAATRTVDEAISAAFDQCSGKRKVALVAIAASFRTLGMSEARAAREAEETLADNERMMADKLRADITTFRRTGKPPTDGPN